MAEGNDIAGLLTRTTGGLPNWGWGLILVAGVGAAYFLPKVLGQQSGGANPLQQSAAASDQAGASGLGLAIDPTTGLPYAVEGLVPSGSPVAGGITVSTPGPAGTNPTLPSGTKISYGAGGRVFYTPPGGQQQNFSSFANGDVSGKSGYSGFCPGCITQVQSNGSVLARSPGSNNWWLLIPPAGHSTTRTPNEPARSISVPRWPESATSLAALGSKYQLSIEKLESLNPGITRGDTIDAGQQIRIA
jgi:hypothetical protein